MKPRTGVPAVGLLLLLSAAAACLNAREVRAAVPGDSFDDPFPVGALPFRATGTTCGFADDVLFPCGPTGPAPDVFYRFTPDHEVRVTVSTCGSSFYGSFALYGERRQFLFCPSYCLNGGWTDLHLLADSTYYFVIDGDNTSCGEYIFTIEDCGGTCEDAIVRCPPDALHEGEDACVPGYVDEFNNGACTAAGCHVSPVPCTGRDVTICGTIGRIDGIFGLDSDVYEFAQSTTSDVTISVSNGHAILFVSLIRVEDGELVEGIVGALRINHGTVFSGPLGPGTYWAILTVDERNTAPCANRSLIQFSGLSCAPTPAQPSSWGALKAAYR